MFTSIRTCSFAKLQGSIYFPNWESLLIKINYTIMYVNQSFMTNISIGRWHFQDVQI